MNCKLAVAPKFTKWEPSTIFSDTPLDKFALVILNRELQLPISVYSRLWANAVYKVAADGGANRLYDLNKNTCNNISDNASPPFLHLNCIVGDLDSLRPDSRAYWVQQKVPIIHYPEQDSTDFAKAVYHIRNHFIGQHENKEEENQKSIDIVVLGDLSGRIDHAMSILHNLYTLQEKVDEENEYLAGRLYLVSSEAITFMLQAGTHKVEMENLERNQLFNHNNNQNSHINNIKDNNDLVKINKHVGIIPLKESSIISTLGLQWDVTNWETQFGGQISTSNYIINNVVSIQTSKDILITLELDILSHQDETQHIIH